jgi:hypothetical protein
MYTRNHIGRLLIIPFRQISHKVSHQLCWASQSRVYYLAAHERRFEAFFIEHRERFRQTFLLFWDFLLPLIALDAHIHVVSARQHLDGVVRMAESAYGSE